MKSDFYASLGQAVRNARESAGLTQADLANLIGVSRPSLTNMELGRQRLLVDQLVVISEAVGKPVADLLPGHSTRTPSTVVPDELAGLPKVSSFVRQMRMNVSR